MKKFSLYTDILSFTATHLPFFNEANWTVFFYTMKESTLQVQAVEMYLSSLSNGDVNRNSNSSSTNLILLTSALSLLSRTAFDESAKNEVLIELALRLFKMCHSFPQHIPITDSSSTVIDGYKETETSIAPQSTPIPVLLSAYCHLIPLLGKAQSGQLVHRYFDEAMNKQGYADSPLAYMMLVNAYMRASNYLSDYKGTLEICLTYIEDRDVTASSQAMVHLLKACARLDSMAVFGLKAYSQWAATVDEPDIRVCSVVATLVDKVLYKQCVNLFSPSESEEVLLTGGRDALSGPFAHAETVSLRDISTADIEEANSDRTVLLLQIKIAESFILKSYSHFQKSNSSFPLPAHSWATPLLAARGRLTDQNLHHLLSSDSDRKESLLRIGMRLVCEGQWQSLLALTERVQSLDVNEKSMSSSTRGLLCGLSLRAMLGSGQYHLLAPYCRHFFSGICDVTLSLSVESAAEDGIVQLDVKENGGEVDEEEEESSLLQIVLSQLTTPDICVFPSGSLSVNSDSISTITQNHRRRNEESLVTFLRHALIPYLRGVERWPGSGYAVVFSELIQDSDLTANDIEYLIDSAGVAPTTVDKHALLAVFSGYISTRLDPQSDLDMSKDERKSLLRLQKSLNEYE